MALQTNLRSIADNGFIPETRGKGISFAIALFLAKQSINKSASHYAEFHANENNQFISTINETVLFDIRHCMALTEQLYQVLLTLKTEPIVLDPKATTLVGSLVNFSLISQEDQTFYQEHYATIATLVKTLETETF